MQAAPVRAIQGAPVTVTFTSLDSTGEPSAVDPGTVTVDVTAADGTAVTTAAATSGTGATRTYTLSAAQTANLDRLTVTWEVGGVAIGSTTVDVVGAVLIDSAGVRALEPTLSDQAINPTASLVRACSEVDALLAREIPALSFVPRFDTATMWHRGQRMLQLPHFHLRRVRWARYWYDDADYTTVAPSLLTGIRPSEAGLALLYDDAESWPVGRIEVGYEHGMDGPPMYVRKQVAAAVRRMVNQPRAGTDPRAMSVTNPQGETQRFTIPGLGPWVTGVPEIDQVIQSYKDAYRLTRVG